MSNGFSQSFFNRPTAFKSVADSACADSAFTKTIPSSKKVSTFSKIRSCFFQNHELAKSFASKVNPFAFCSGVCILTTSEKFINHSYTGRAA